MTTTTQALLTRVNAKRAACTPPRAPVTLHQLGAVLLLRGALVDLLGDVFGGDFRLSLLALGVPLDPEYTPTYVCSVCGGENVEHAFWADPNTEEVGGEFGTWNYDDTRYCQDCGANHKLVEVSDSGDAADVASDHVSVYAWTWSGGVDPASVDEVTSGTLAAAIEAAQDVATASPNVLITLTDERGSTKGWVRADGSWRLV